MTSYQEKMQLATKKSADVIQRIEEGATLKSAVRTFLNEERDGKTNFRRVMEAKIKLAENACSEMVRNEAQNSLLRFMADGDENGSKGGSTSNNQFIINVNPVKADGIEIDGKVINQ